MRTAYLPSSQSLSSEILISPKTVPSEYRTRSKVTASADSVSFGKGRKDAKLYLGLLLIASLWAYQSFRNARLGDTINPDTFELTQPALVQKD